MMVFLVVVLLGVLIGFAIAGGKGAFAGTIISSGAYFVGRVL